MAAKAATKSAEPKKLNAFNGVFLPTFLSIIGVVLYLRLGYVVGAGGILTAIAIILLSVSVTLATGLSLSALTTTMKIGKGGAYSIVNKTLGLEVGGSVGIPLYLAQVFSVVFYLFGFSEAWRFIFPNHPAQYVAFAAFVVLLLLSLIRLRLALSTQYVVFVIVILAFISILAGDGQWWEGGPSSAFDYRLS